MTSPATKVAIIGAAGWAGRRHASAFSQAGAQLLDLVDPSPLVAEVAERFGGRPCASIEQANLDDADLVVVALPASYQVPLVASLLSKGHRVLEEKPLALTSDDAQHLLGCDGAADRLDVCYTLNTHPLLPRVREWVDSHHPFSVTVRSVATKFEMSGWRADPKEGGALFVNAIHSIELICSLLDETPSVRSATCSSQIFGSAVPEFVSAGLLFPSGLSYELQCYWAPWPNKSGLNQGDWDLSFDFVSADSRLVWHNDTLAIDGRGRPHERIEVDPTDLFYRQALNAIEFAHGAAPTVGVQRSARATQVAHEILDAAQAHRYTEVMP